MDIDVAIVGAGTAGAAAAWQLARRGLRVVAVDRLPLDRTGARWSNGVSLRAYDRAGLPRPTGDEDRGGPAMHLIAGWGPTSVRVESDLREIDMRALGQRLIHLAMEAGARIAGDVEVTGWTEEEGLQTRLGPLRARWYVDASGMHGVPWLSHPRVPKAQMCTAAQQTRRLRDRGAARDWFDRFGVPEGEVACFTSVAGGYSIVNVRYHGDEMAILTGSMPADGVPAGPALLRRFVEEHSDWIGQPLWGGARAIPLALPLRDLHEGPWIRFGDAAGMVYAAHGSGIGPQLVGSQLLGRTLASGGTAADFSRRWHATEGRELRRAHAFHRFSRTIDSEDLGRLVRAGLMHPELVRSGLEQRRPRVQADVVAALARGLVRDPRALGVASRALSSLAG